MAHVVIVDMIERARDLSRESGTSWTDQLNNEDSMTGYEGLGWRIQD